VHGHHGRGPSSALFDLSYFGIGETKRCVWVMHKVNNQYEQ